MTAFAYIVFVRFTYDVGTAVVGVFLLIIVFCWMKYTILKNSSLMNIRFVSSFVAVVNKAAVYIYLQVFQWTYTVFSFGYVYLEV